MKLARWPAGPRLLVLSVPTLAALLAAFTFGPYSLTPGEVLAALLAGPAATGDAATVVWNLRLPRIAAGLLVGMALKPQISIQRNFPRVPATSS